MFSDAREIREGDIIIIWFTREQLQPLTVISGKELHGRYGAYKHSDFIGLRYGSKVASRNGKGFIHVLRPTPELWTLALPHRTQILYLADISFITSWLGIKPGSVVIEAGTGSGSFSHSVARVIGTDGHLYSFEFHEARMHAAREEFEQHGMSSFVTLKHQNVCKDGFGLDSVVDAVFLDVPAPWEAIISAKRALKKHQVSRICCFSPCIEQVLRTVSALNDAGLAEITTYETLLRPQEVNVVPVHKDIEEVSTRLKVNEVKREGRRLRQIELSRLSFEAKRKEKEAAASRLTEEGPSEAAADRVYSGVKRKRGTDTPSKPQDTPKRLKSQIVKALPKGATGMDLDGPDDSDGDIKLKRTDKQSTASNSHPSTSVSSTSKTDLLNVARPYPEVRGHTSYLTFAVLLPVVYPGSEAGLSNVNQNSSNGSDGRKLA